MGHYLHTANQNSDNVSEFAIGPGGTLTAIGTGGVLTFIGTVATGSGPNAVNTGL